MASQGWVVWLAARILGLENIQVDDQVESQDGVHGQISHLPITSLGGLVDPALVVDAALLELLEGVVQPVVEAGGLAVLQLPDEDVLEAASRGVSSE